MSDLFKELMEFRREIEKELVDYSPMVRLDLKRYSIKISVSIVVSGVVVSSDIELSERHIKDRYTSTTHYSKRIKEGLFRLSMQPMSIFKVRKSNNNE